MIMHGGRREMCKEERKSRWKYLRSSEPKVPTTEAIRILRYPSQCGPLERDLTAPIKAKS
jgi:hypothetical protein